MKKVALLTMLILSLLLGACTQAKPQAGEAKGKQEEQKSDYPTKPIELIVPYAPGGSTDTIARTLANTVSKHLPNGQSVVVINKPGGSGTIGLTEVSKAKPDGYKIGFTTTTATSVQPHYGNAPFTHNSFQTILRVTSVPQVLVVKSDAPWKTFEEWLEYVKQNPGEFTYSVPTKAGSQYMAMEALSSATDIKVKDVPFDGAAPALTSLLGGHVQGMVVQSQDAIAQIEEGTIRALVNVGGTKTEGIEDIPLLTEKGIDVTFNIYGGLLAPKGLPQQVLNTLHDAFKKSMEDPEVIEQLKNIGSEPSYSSPEEFQKEITDSFNANGEVMKNAVLIK